MRKAAAAGLFLALAASSVTAAQEFVVVDQGRPACAIVTSARPSPAARLAALEIQAHVFKMTGARLPVVASDAPASASDRTRRILVGESAATRELGLRGSDFAPQEYAILFRPDSVVLIGRDWDDTEANRRVQGIAISGGTLQELRHSIDYARAVGVSGEGAGRIELPGIYDDQGTCLAAYDFLERFCGVRWYGPAELNVVIPRSDRLAFAVKDVRRSPALKHRNALVSGSWPYLRGQWGEFTQDQLHLYHRRNRQGGERWSGNHTFHRETIKNVFTDPEYQCRNPRGAGSQLCYTHPKLIAQVAQMARDFFDGKGQLPPGWKAMGDYFAIVPDDNMNLCNCERCQALLDRPGVKTGYFSGGGMSEYWFTFVNAVAREVRRTHPDKYIATLAYWEYAFPPSFAMEPNVSVAPCLHTCYYPVHPGMKENDFKFYEGWREKVTTPMFLWVYYHHPMEPALIEKWKCFPHVMIHDTARAMRRHLDDGIRGIFQCGEQDQLEQYVMAKIWDDPSIDVDATIDEFFKLYFGPAAEPMERFYLRLEQIACDPANYPPPYLRSNGIGWRQVAWERLGTEERMAELGQFIAAAERLAVQEPEKQRVKLWRQAIWDWMLEGRKSTPTKFEKSLGF